LVRGFGASVFLESSCIDSGRVPRSPSIEVVAGGNDGQAGHGKGKTVAAGLGRTKIKAVKVWIFRRRQTTGTASP